MAAPDVLAFAQLVHKMMSSDNAERSAAEQQYNGVEIQPRCQALFQVFLDQSVDIEIRSMAVVLLRRLLANNWSTLWPAFGQQNQKAFCDQLLQSLAQEKNDLMRRRLVDIIAEVARNSVDDDTGAQTWTDVVAFIDGCSSSSDAGLKEAALGILENVPNVLGDQLEQHLNAIKSIFNSGLVDPSDRVKTAAARAFAAFLIDNDDSTKVVKVLGPLVDSILQLAASAVEKEDVDDTPLQCLGDIAATLPKLLTTRLDRVVPLCVGTIAAKDKSENYRHAAMEVLTTICEASPGVMRKKGSVYVPHILRSCLLLMCELEDDISEWLVDDQPDQSDNDAEETVAVGESSLDRVSNSLQGKVVFPHFWPLADQLLNSHDWKERHAGLMGISTVGEGSARAIEPEIERIVARVIPFLNDQHERVRYAACNAIGQMSTDFSPTLQKKCHEVVVPCLLKVFCEVSVPRVAAHAGAALVNFTEECPKALIAPHLPVLLENAAQVLDATFAEMQLSKRRLHVEQAMTTIASIADSAQDHFKPYYQKFIDPLKLILQQTAGVEELRTLRGKCIECITLIGLGVGTEMFTNDAKHVMELLGPQMALLELDDPQCSYMITAWTRICKVLGKDFAPYLPHVMPAVLKAAAHKPETALVDEEEAQGGIADDADWQVVNVGGQKTFGIRTSGLEEKETACDMLVCYARELKEHFLPWVPQVAELALEHLKFLFHDGVRVAAADTLPALLGCLKPQGVAAQRQLFVQFLPALVGALESETDLETHAELLNSVAECVQEMGREGIVAEELQQLAQLMHSQLEDYEKRREDRADAQDDDEDGDEAAEKDDEEGDEKLGDDEELESDVLCRITDILHNLLEEFGEVFFPYMQPIIGQIIPLLGRDRPYRDRQWGLCALDDLVEFAPTSVAPHQASIVNAMVAALGDEFPEVRQAAAYGIGIMALKGGEAWQQSYVAALPSLVQLIQSGDSQTEEGSIARDNAISAVVKILKNASASAPIDRNNLIPLLLTWLPTLSDAEEGPHVYGFLLELVAASNPLVMGENNCNLPKIVEICVKALHYEAIDEDAENAATVKENVMQLLRQIKNDPNLLGQLSPHITLTEDERATFARV